MVSTGARGVVQRHMELVNQRGKVVQEGVMGLMMWCRETSAARNKPID